MAPPGVEVRWARGAESALVSSVLAEAARWVAGRGAPLWPLEAVGTAAIVEDVVAGRFVLALAGTEAVGTARCARCMRGWGFRLHGERRVGGFTLARYERAVPCCGVASARG